VGKLLALALTLLLAACGGGGDQRSAGAGAAPGADGFRTRTPEVLTVGTGLPNPPFVLGDDLDHLKGGFEVDMVNEIAKRLGVPKVEWVGFPFTKLVAGARCPCDFAVNGVSILPDRRQRVDFSSPYFTANQEVLVRKGTTVNAMADARQLHFGVQVVDAAHRYPGLAVAGQFKTDEQYGAVLAKGSPNTRPLSEVIDQLRDGGVLDQLFQKYFPEQVNIPSLG
jgi:polar amino acid transport system substrate-binding protein